MNKYTCILNKIQRATIEIEWDENTSITYLLDKIEDMNDAQIVFSAPEYVLEAITKEEGKITKFIWEISP